VREFYFFALIQISDGARDAQDFVKCSGGEPQRVKTLLDDYSDVSLSAMGFPDDWREYALWK